MIFAIYLGIAAIFFLFLLQVFFGEKSIDGQEYPELTLGEYLGAALLAFFWLPVVLFFIMAGILFTLNDIFKKK